MLKSKTHKLANWRWAFQQSRRNATVKIVQRNELPSRWKEKLIIACWGKISLALGLIPRGKKIIEIFYFNFLQCSQPMSLSNNTFKKIGHCACLRDTMGPNLPHLCLYWHLSRASFHRFMVYFCGSWKQVFLKKHFIVRKECVRTYSPDYVIFMLRMYGAILSFKVFLRVFRHKERRTLNCFGGWHQWEIFGCLSCTLIFSKFLSLHVISFSIKHIMIIFSSFEMINKD